MERLAGRDRGQQVPLTRAELLELVKELEKIRQSMVELEGSVSLDQFGPRRRSAQNLLHYVALRRQDIRAIQERLSEMGISSLGRSESGVLYNIDAVISILRGLTREAENERTTRDGVPPAEGKKILGDNADALFGPREGGRSVRIMVTLPTEAATDYNLVRDLVAGGMDCARINCAHDGEEEWLLMTKNLKRAEVETGKKCRILMDIAGPKLRTGALLPGPQVLRIRPQRDAFGRVTSPAKVAFVREPSAQRVPDTSTPVLEVDAGWHGLLQEGDEVGLIDSRGSKRTLRVTGVEGALVMAESKKSIYLGADTRLVLKKGGGTYSTAVKNIPAKENPILLNKADALIVTSDQGPGRNATADGPARIACTLPEALPFIHIGERVWFDDGKVGSVVKSTSQGEVRVEITHVDEQGGKLRADKGINLPDTNLKLPPLTPKDEQDLKFIVDHADMVGYSFVRTPEDLGVLRSRLASLGSEDIPIVLKIETSKAFEQLPSLLLESMRGPLSGAMIARGDLAVECGYERLAEVQEEILWMAEAAHMPTIWATQVLEGLTKNGVPSRAEVTDAAMGGRSECVMLNKGPHVVEALRALDNILTRMQAHQAKKRSLMRRLNIASGILRTPAN